MKCLSCGQDHANLENMMEELINHYQRTYGLTLIGAIKAIAKDMKETIATWR